MSIKNTIYRGRVRTVEDAVSFWKVSHDDAMAVRDIEDVVEESLAAIRILVEWQKEGWTLLLSGRLKNILEYGNSLRRAYVIGQNLIQAVSECIDRAEAGSYVVDNAGKYRSEIRELERLRKEFLAKWPFPTRAELTASEVDDYLDLGEVVNELRHEDQAKCSSHD
jgi:hypothetical protein